MNNLKERFLGTIDHIKARRTEGGERFPDTEEYVQYLSPRNPGKSHKLRIITPSGTIIEMFDSTMIHLHDLRTGKLTERASATNPPDGFKVL